MKRGAIMVGIRDVAKRIVLQSFPGPVFTL